MRRRRYLAALACGVGSLAGCGRFDGPADVWPEPSVVDHVRGRVAITDLERWFVLGADADDRYRVTVENTGHDATVQVTLYWQPADGGTPAEKTRPQLRDAGYVVGDRTEVRIPGGETRTVALGGPRPADTGGPFLRARNLTYGATVANGGGRGTVTATLVDTTDLSATRTLARKSVTLPAAASRDVTFRSAATFETFRVDVSVPLLGGEGGGSASVAGRRPPSINR